MDKQVLYSEEINQLKNYQDSWFESDVSQLYSSLLENDFSVITEDDEWDAECNPEVDELPWK